MTYSNVRLGDVATVEREAVGPSKIPAGSLYVGLENIERGGRLVDVRPTVDGQLDSLKYRFNDSHVLFGKLRPYLAKIARPAFAGICSTEILPISPGPRLDRNYLAHYLAQPQIVSFATSRSTGANLPRLSPIELAKFEIPLPTIEEQRRIADILDRADALRAKRREALAHLRALTKSTFQQMFADSGPSSKPWPIYSLAELCRVLGGKRLPKGADYSADPTPFRYIRVTDLHGGRVVQSFLKFLSAEVQSQVSRYTVSEGDVIISIAGSIGQVAPVPRSLSGANLTENAAKLVPRSSDLYTPGYLSQALRSKASQEQIRQNIGQVTIGKLALFRIEDVEVSLPPIQLQQEFDRRAGLIAREEALLEQSAAGFDSLFVSLQQRAFSDEL